MKKQITSIFLVAGTCIGGGIIALPMVLAKLGIVPSLVIMFLSWIITYYPSLVSVELNLHLDRGLPLGPLAQKFSGKTAAIIGEISLKLLSYALMAVYIYGASSIIQKLLQIYWGCPLPSFMIQSCLTIFVATILLFPMKMVSQINNIAFLGFLIILSVLVITVLNFTDVAQIPWVVAPSRNNIASVITVVFTSFGYQIIFHTLRDYCGKNPGILRRAFLFGSLFPIVVYMLWTGSVLGAIYKSNPGFFSQMVAGNIDVGDLVSELANISKFPRFQLLVWWMSMLAIFTSILGVELSLAGSLDLVTKDIIKSKRIRNLCSSILTVVPAYLLAIIVPNAFIKILGFAGTILVVIAILLPIYLFFKADIKNQYLPELKKWPLILCVIAGIGVILADNFCR